MQKIVFVSHCILNTASKVVLYNQEEMDAEEALRKKFMHLSIDRDIQLIQLPCPEFTLYGANRWGHVSNQFDNVFFRRHCRNILSPILDQLKEYLAHGERFEILGIVGIDGSPSCGVDYTCTGDWYGSFEGRQNLVHLSAFQRQRCSDVRSEGNAGRGRSGNQNHLSVRLGAGKMPGADLPGRGCESVTDQSLPIL